MLGINALMREVAEREKLETVIGEYGSKWKNRRQYGGILVYGEPITLDEWENPTEEGYYEMLRQPDLECAQNLTGYRIAFERVEKKPLRDTQTPTCYIDGHVDFAMVLHALNTSVRLEYEYPRWIPDATFTKKEWFGLKGEFRGVPMSDLTNPMYHVIFMRIGDSDGERIIPRRLKHDWCERHLIEKMPIRHPRFDKKESEEIPRRFRVPVRARRKAAVGG